MCTVSFISRIQEVNRWEVFSKRRENVVANYAVNDVIRFAKTPTPSSVIDIVGLPEF